MRAALSFAAGWAALVCVGGTAWLAWRAWRKGPRVDPWSDDAYTAALEADAKARAVRGALAELDELEAWLGPAGGGGAGAGLNGPWRAGWAGGSVLGGRHGRGARRSANTSRN